MSMKLIQRNPLDDFRPPPTLDGFIDPNHHRQARCHKRRHQQPQQNPAQPQAAPLIPVQHPVILPELALLTQAHRPQRRRHRSLVRRQDRPDQQRLG
jgi:hypothetical protein